MNVKNIIEKYPFLESLIIKGQNDEMGESDLDMNAQIVKALTLPDDPNMILVSTMWVDCGVDSASDVVGLYNGKLIKKHETSQDGNLTTTTHIIQREANGDAFVLVIGHNGQSGWTFTLYIA